MKQVLLIAEIGINHNGNIDIAKQMITAAKESGFDCVKFQKRSIDEVYSKEYLDSYRESPWGTTQRAQKEGLEFGEKEYDIINRFCHEQDIGWFASAWDISSQYFLRKYHLKYNKVASAMLTKMDFLHKVAEEKKYTFISTGMSELEEIDKAVEIFKKHDCPFELMHCNSTYPTDDKDANLSVMKTLKNRYHCNVGYSGHEHGIIVSYTAAVLGASSIERHITLDKSMYGSDQMASILPSEMQQLAKLVRSLPEIMGSGKKRIEPTEMLVRRKLVT